MAVFVLPVARAIDDVPMGALRWVQGFDGNQPTSGFRVDGTLRIEAPDEPQPVGIPLESGRIEVGPRVGSWSTTVPADPVSSRATW